MNKLIPFIAAAAVLISGCRNNSGIRGFWAEMDLDVETDYAAAESQFTDFVELASKSPQADAFAAIDKLLSRARKDEFAYLVYTEWIYRGFSPLASPCRSCPIFVHAAKRILSEGILRDELASQFEKRMNFCMHNGTGKKATLPANITCTQKTLFLVVDQDCPSCKEAMQRITHAEYPDTHFVALCYGHGPMPDAPGWECMPLPSDQTILDTREAPFFFIVSEDGTIEQSYTQT